MALLTKVRNAIGTDTVVYECRHCGKTLQSDLDECPTCGKDAVIKYEVD